MTLYIPNNLRIDEMVTAYPPGIKSFNKEKLLFIVHSIIIAKTNGRRIYGDGYVTINSTTLLKVLGNEYSKYVLYLRARQVIELYFAPGGETFLIGKHSQAYRLYSKYLTQVTRYEVQKLTLARRIIHYFKDEAIETRKEEAESRTMVDEVSEEPLVPGAGYDFDKLFDPKPRVPKKAAKKVKKVKVIHKSDVLNLREFEWNPLLFKGMYKWLKDGELSISRDLVDEYLKIKLAVQHVDLDSRDWDWGDKEPKNPIEQFNAAMILADQVESGDYDNLHFDNSIRRFYNIISLMPKMLRNGLTYDGKAIVAIDISNSQPYMSNLFFKTAFWEATESTHLKITDLGITPPLVFDSEEVFSSFIMFLKKASNPLLARVYYDRILYRKLTSNGEFYKYVDKEIGFGNIPAVKKSLYIVFFSHNRAYLRDDDFKRDFKRLFPTVLKLFYSIKQKNQRNLAHLYFAVETYVMYYRIVMRIQKELPKVPFWTIHDGIATTVGNEGAIGAIMDEELTKAIGVKPHMKVEYWQEEKIQAEIARYQAVIEKKGLAGKIREAVTKGEL